MNIPDPKYKKGDLVFYKTTLSLYMVVGYKLAPAASLPDNVYYLYELSPAREGRRKRKFTYGWRAKWPYKFMRKGTFADREVLEHELYTPEELMQKIQSHKKDKEQADD